MKKKVMLFSCDPGGANAVFPLFKPLQEKGCQVLLFGKNYALKRFKKFFLPAIGINKFFTKTTYKNVYFFLNKVKPQIIITGTSGEDFTERYLWQAARKLNIPSFAIIDHWTNYKIRFSKYKTSEREKFNKDNRIFFLPKKIFVPDNFAKKEMVSLGFLEKDLLATGNPYFQFLNFYERQAKKQLQIRKKLKISPNSFLITYASEPTFGKKTLKYLGYTEKTIFQNIYKALKDIVSKYKLEITFLIKLHPREKVNNYRKVLKTLKNKKIEMKVDKNTLSLDLILASDLICGMNSMFLIESVLLHKPTLSIQIGLKKKDPFILSKRGILKPILKQQELIKKMESIIIKKAKTKLNFKVIKNPVDNIISNFEGYIK